jgi:hypothetical protein
LPTLSRDELVAVFDGETSETNRTQIWFDPTPEGEAFIEAIPSDRMPRISGTVQRPWLE